VAVATKKNAKAEAGTKKGCRKQKPSGEKAAGSPAKAVKAKKKAPAKRVAAKTQAGRKPGKQRTIPGSEENDPGVAEMDPFEVAKRKMKGSVPAIVEAMVLKAKQGSCSHAKTLLEMTGVRHMFGEGTEAQENGEPWAKLVLARMAEAEQESLQEASPEDAAEIAGAAGGRAGRD
jgi:hypothetical protein